MDPKDKAEIAWHHNKVSMWADDLQSVLAELHEENTNLRFRDVRLTQAEKELGIAISQLRRYTRLFASANNLG